jgi:hypothetical protein
MRYLGKYISESDVTSPEANVLLIILRSAATYISRSVAYASDEVIFILH